MELLHIYAVFGLFITAYAIDPVVLITETDPSVEYGTTIIAERDRDVTLSCFVENLPQDTFVIWQKTVRDAKGLESTSPISTDQALEDNISFGIEKPTTYTWRLRIRSVAVNDEGNYTCYVQVAQQIKIHANRTLIVYVRPTIDPVLTSFDMTVDENSEVELTCNATGRPQPTITWERQGKALLPVGMEKYRGSLMAIPSIRPEHRGLYKCIALNYLGRTVREINVNIRFAPIITPVHRQLRQKIGYVIELQCLIESNPEPSDSQLRWYKGSTRISQSTGRFTVQTLKGAFSRLTYELIIGGVRQSDFGVYRCEVENSQGRTSGIITLSKSNRPQDSVKLSRPIASAPAGLRLETSALCFTLLTVLLSKLLH